MDGPKPHVQGLGLMVLVQMMGMKQGIKKMMKGKRIDRSRL